MPLWNPRPSNISLSLSRLSKRDTSTAVVEAGLRGLRATKVAQFPLCFRPLIMPLDHRRLSVSTSSSVSAAELLFIPHLKHRSYPSFSAAPKMRPDALCFFAALTISFCSVWTEWFCLPQSLFPSASHY